MYRAAIEELKSWKRRQNRKPLILRGARQVGKTWLMREFGRACYKEAVYVNFDNNRQMESLFSSGMNTERLVEGLELYAGHRINPDETLLIFDEVQEAPAALTSLKYFCEDAPQYQIICAGSMLGVALHPGTSFPVGKTEFLDLGPLSFSEFLRAADRERFAEVLANDDYELANTFSQEYTELLKKYYYIGGMPEVVQSFTTNGDYGVAREIQQRIVSAYEQDFSKHAPSETVPRIRMLWESVPPQLARENKKFIYGQIREGARARDYELALLWLTDCGLVHKVHRAAAPRIPLKAYEDIKAFKLYMLDVGLLSCMARLSAQTLLTGSELFTEFKGALTEQYVLQQMKTLKNVHPYYWTNDRGSAEIDFLLESGGEIIPVEVKAETNLRAKSLKSYREKFQPRRAVRVSMAHYSEESGLLNLPLWAVERICG